MKEYKKIIINFIKDIKYIIPVIITAILGFGFVLTHHSINIDTLCFNRYYQGQELISQDRFGPPLLNKIFNIFNFNPFFVDFLAVIFLIFAAILFCALFKKISANKLNPIVYTIFSCLFISYPLMPEIFTYTPASLSVCLSYCLVALALMLCNEYIENKNKSFLISSALIICLVISIYESFAAVYLLGVFIILILKVLYSDNKYKFSKIFIDFLKFLMPLILGLILQLVIAKSLKYLLAVSSKGRANKTITYMSLGIIGGLKNAVKSIIVKYIASAFCYIPIAVFTFSVLLAILIAFISSIKTRNFLIFLLFIGLIFSSISLSFIQGMASPYRTCQTFAIFIGFIFMLLSQFILTSRINKFTKNLLIFLICLIIFYQVKDLHKWFYVNYLRYDEEKNTALLICNEIEKEYGIDTPIIVVGQMSLSNNINKYLYIYPTSWNAKVYNKILSVFNISYQTETSIRISETNVNSYISWGTLAFNEPSVEIVKFLNFLGYDFKAGTYDMYTEALEKSKTLSAWPKEGSIVKTDDFVLVNL